MLPYQHEFIDFAIEQNVLQFGEYKLKSGRISPYFFNSGLFNNGESLARLGSYYAEAITTTDVQFDMVFGPAYKGIPLASSFAIALFRKLGRSVPYSFNRKEEKDHGEGGIILGAPLSNRVLIIDDVITAGTSINKSMELILSAGANPTAVIIALDRQERGIGELSAVQEIEQISSIPVFSIITLETLIDYVEQTGKFQQHLETIQKYQESYGV